MHFSLIVKSVLILSLLAAAAPLRAQNAAAYVISDSTTGFILDQSNATKKLQVGSLTKVATAMVVLDWATARGEDLSQLATVPGNAAQLAGAPGVVFQTGDRCSLRDLLYAALMQSDNIAALTLADHVGRALGGGRGEVSAPDFFVGQMNALARRLGMERTRFVNPHGLDHLERTLPFSTAEDLAKLTTYAMANSGFRFYVSQKERKIAIETATGPGAYLLRNTNELVGVDGIDGVKTGTTTRAGQCLILSAAKTPESRQEGGEQIVTPRRLNVIVLGSADRFNAANALLQRGWREYEAWAAAGRPTKDWKPRR